jgi:translation initiation factor IF-3
VRLIDETETQVGVVPIEQARTMAVARGLDLVEVVPNAQPPVAKILDYGKFLYHLKKEEKKAKSKSRSSEMKEVRLSLRISEHDLEVKASQARRFLTEGDRVKMNLRFRGREITHKDLGLARMKTLITRLADIAVIDQAPSVMGNMLSAIVRPK